MRKQCSHDNGELILNIGQCIILDVRQCVLLSFGSHDCRPVDDTTEKEAFRKNFVCQEEGDGNGGVGGNGGGGCGWQNIVAKFSSMCPTLLLVTRQSRWWVIVAMVMWRY